MRRPRPTLPTALSALAALALLASAAPADAREITLYPGEQTVLDVSAIKRIAVGNPSVVEASVLGDGREVLLVGRGQGRTNVIVWNVEGRQDTIYVNVVPAGLADKVRQMSDMLGDTPGIEIKVVGTMVVVGGTAATSDDYDKVARVAQLFSARNLVERPAHNPAADALIQERLRQMQELHPSSR